MDAAKAEVLAFIAFPRSQAATEEEAVELAIRRVIREGVTAAGTAGFVTGLGGLVTMPVTVPTNMAGALVINARMVGAIAHLRGYALDDPHIRAMIPLVVADSSAQGFASELGSKLGQAVTKQAIKAIPMSVIHRANARAGIYLVAKYGAQRSAITLAKAVPFGGGVVGGDVDATLTRALGALAKRAFPA